MLPGNAILNKKDAGTQSVFVYLLYPAEKFFV